MKRYGHQAQVSRIYATGPYQRRYTNFLALAANMQFVIKMVHQKFVDGLEHLSYISISLQRIYVAYTHYGY